MRRSDSRIPQRREKTGAKRGRSRGSETTAPVCLADRHGDGTRGRPENRHLVCSDYRLYAQVDSHGVRTETVLSRRVQAGTKFSDLRPINGHPNAKNCTRDPKQCPPNSPDQSPQAAEIRKPELQRTEKANANGQEHSTPPKQPQDSPASLAIIKFCEFHGAF